ncbi:hypothetical protein MBLNU13_g00084t1 [Cladosporium sp. NU13]
MSPKKSPQFADVVDGVQLAQNITASQTAEELDTFEKITFRELVSYQRFVKIAELKPDETVLDLACGPGLRGLLVCEQLGKEGALNVTFADASSPLLEKAKRNIRQFSDPEFPLDHFHHIEDMRSFESLSRLKQDATGGVGFDVRLLTLLTPGGRIVIDWPLPSSSHIRIRGPKGANESIGTLFGYQQIITPQGWNDLGNWKLESQLNVKTTEVWVTRNEKKNSQKKLNEFVTKAGGKVVKFDESDDRTGGNGVHLEQLKVRRAINSRPREAGEGVQLSYEREQLACELSKTEKLDEIQKVGEWEFMNVLLDYRLHAAVKPASEEWTKTAPPNSG